MKKSKNITMKGEDFYEVLVDALTKAFADTMCSYAKSGAIATTNLPEKDRAVAMESVTANGLLVSAMLKHFAGEFIENLNRALVGLPDDSERNGKPEAPKTWQDLLRSIGVEPRE